MKTYIRKQQEEEKVLNVAASFFVTLTANMMHGKIALTPDDWTDCVPIMLRTIVECKELGKEQEEVLAELVYCVTQLWPNVQVDEILEEMTEYVEGN